MSQFISKLPTWSRPKVARFVRTGESPIPNAVRKSLEQEGRESSVRTLDFLVDLFVGQDNGQDDVDPRPGVFQHKTEDMQAHFNRTDDYSELAIVSEEGSSVTYMMADQYFSDTVILHQGELVDGNINSAARVDHERPDQSFEFWQGGAQK